MKGLLREGWDAQFGFMPGRERGGGCNIRGAVTYGETGKACNRALRQEVWRRNREKGLPDNYVIIVQEMYEGGRTLAKTNVHGQ